MSLEFLSRVPAFEGLVRALEAGEKAVAIQGVVDAAKPYVLAGLARRLDRRIVYIRPGSRSLDQAERECRFFLEALGVGAAPVTLPALSDNPYLEVPPSLDAISRRMRFFYGLGRGERSLVLTEPLGLLQPFPAPATLERAFLRVEVGQTIDRDDLLKTLATFGYAKQDLIASHGEYAWRGGVADVFSPWEANPLRIEWSGDSVASLREFDTSTQRSVKRLTQAVIPSLREFPGDADFYEVWRKAARRAAGPAARDLEAKVKLVESGELFPSFGHAALAARDHFVPFTDFLADALFILEDPDEVEKDWQETLALLHGHHAEHLEAGICSLPPETLFPPALWAKVKKEAAAFLDLGAPGRRKTFAFAFQAVPRFDNRVPFFIEYLKKRQEERDLNYIFLANTGTRQRLRSLLADADVQTADATTALVVPPRGEVVLLVGGLARGFAYPAEKVAFFAEKDVFTEEKVIVSRPARRAFLSQFQDLGAGDYIVHTDYGIGVFEGLRRLEVEGHSREFIEIHYRDGDKLLVPVEDLNLVQKFSRVGGDAPLLDKLGTQTWEKTKARAKKAVKEIAEELLALYAKRRSVQGHAFSGGGEWEAEFDKIFTYEETDDQLRSIREVRADMETSAPMDRLLCGDVGYGKTEVAMRAAFKAVMDGKQVAVLCPTTVLASQHLHTFRERMVLFPVRVEALTRLQSKAEQTRLVADIKSGQVDTVIGTHRLLSGDVVFRDLGLLIVDEEQRFGVGHKEKIKQLRASIDVLTLTATPIPRTLNMSLSGLRDISLIETPPRDRLAVHTVVTPWSAKLIGTAIRQELARGGQVYYVHNRIEDIDKVAAFIAGVAPQARVVTVHGQMTGAVLEKRMLAFINREANVLVSTTIIENGIDIPLVNTLIVDRADLFGLAQLYQLRGRVGRSSRQAFAYFLVPPFLELTPLARERLKALKEFSALGSGFRLAAKDLEIRGAGSLLGHRQHGTLEAVGFDYYMHLLDLAVREVRGERVEEVKTELNLKVDIRIPEGFLPQVNLRLNIYKRLSSLDDLGELDRIRQEIIDRFGPLPASVESLLRYSAVKFLAQRLRLASLDRSGPRLLLKFTPESPVDYTRITPLLKRWQGSFSPQGVMSLSPPGDGDRPFLDETVLVLKELSSYTIMN